MKKLLSILLALALVLGCAFAEGSAVESNLVDYDFGDFTMTFAEDMAGEVYDLADNQVYFILYPSYDENVEIASSINCVWTAGSEDLTQTTSEDFANLVLGSMETAYKAQGLTFANPQLLAAWDDELDGQHALNYLAQYELEGYVLYIMQVAVSNTSFGTYTFTVTTADLTEMDSLSEIIGTVKWTV